MGVDELSAHLLEKGFHLELVASFSRNRIDGATFIDLSEDDLKDLAPVIGDRVNIRKLLAKTREVNSTNVYYIEP